MDEIKRINLENIQQILAVRGFIIPLLVKDYYLTLILYLIKDIEGVYFKGGTALNKILLNHARLSEDIDFTLTKNIKEAQTEIINILKQTKLFGNITEDKNVEGYLRMVVHYDMEGQKGEIFIDLNKRGHTLHKTEKHKLNHFYSGYIPEFEVNTVSEEELIAEKVRAAIARNKPRDHFDIYQIIKKGHKINMDIVKQKCHESGDAFSIIKMFNKAQTLKNRWNQDMIPLISEPITFPEVITFLAKHFKLKEEKEKLKDKRPS